AAVHCALAAHTLQTLVRRHSQPRRTTADENVLATAANRCNVALVEAVADRAAMSLAGRPAWSHGSAGAPESARVAEAERLLGGFGEVEFAPGHEWATIDHRHPHRAPV